MRLSLQTWILCDIQGISVFLKYINVDGASVRIGNPDHPSFPGPPCAGLKCPSHSPANRQCDPKISESGRAPRSGLESGCLSSSLPLLPSLHFFKKDVLVAFFFQVALLCSPAGHKKTTHHLCCPSSKGQSPRGHLWLPFGKRAPESAEGKVSQATGAKVLRKTISEGQVPTGGREALSQAEYL